jgi:hypothetical protein
VSSTTTLYLVVTANQRIGRNQFTASVSEAWDREVQCVCVCAQGTDAVSAYLFGGAVGFRALARQVSMGLL